MLSSNDLERLIAEKRYEIEREKIDLGLSRSPDNNVEENKEYNNSKKVQISKKVTENNYVKQGDILEKERSSLEEDIPADLERYIRRCTGLPVMLKAGEYSPNNPLVRGERPAPGGDVMLGLGEYERRRNTLRRIRQQQYREYLDQQAKLKQEAKEKAERERREREEKEREREERERERREIEIASPIGRRASLNYHDVSCGSNNTYITKVDTGVQVESTRPLSVAVQTDDVHLYQMPLVHQKLTEAERELSPRVAGEGTAGQGTGTGDWTHWKDRRRSYGDYDDNTGVRNIKKPAVFDADEIHMRNVQAEKEALSRRQRHQQELRNQILEQQRIREQRRSREKMLEQAEMRRLEEQLRALKSAQTQETYRQMDQNEYMKQQTTEYEKKRILLQNEIEKEKKTLLRSTSYKPVTNLSRDTTQTSHSETTKLPYYYQNKDKPPYSINIPENSIFSQNYDIESYLRKNLNPTRESLISNNLRELRANIDINKPVQDNKNIKDYYTNDKTRDKYTENKNPRDNYTENKNIRDNYTEHNTRDNYTNDKTRDNYTENKNTRDNYTGHKNTRDNYTDNKNTRDNYTENKNTRVDYTENYTENKTIENVTENKNTRENYTNDKNTRENYTINKNTRDNYTIDKNTRENYTDNYTQNKNTRTNYTDNKNNNIIIEKALIHTQPKRNKDDALLIPVLKHSPIKSKDFNENTELSKKMQIVDDKWKIPAVQKNILKTLPKENGKNINILTQLGSIRRQLQLEQLKLDMKDNDD